MRARDHEIWGGCALVEIGSASPYGDVWTHDDEMGSGSRDACAVKGSASREAWLCFPQQNCWTGNLVELEPFA